MMNTIKKYKYEILAVLIALATLIHRMFYISLNKGLWWDSASFLVLTQDILGKTSCAWEPHRLPGFSLLMAPFYQIFGLNISVFVIVGILFAVLSVIGIYFLASKMFNNKNIGIIAALFISLSWLNFFYSLRVLSRIPASVFLIAGLYLFWVGYENKNWKKMLCSGLLFGFYYVIRFDASYVLIAMGIFVIIDFIRSKEKFVFIKRKELWLFAAGVLVVIIPYMIWQMAAFGSPIYQFQLNYELAKGAGQSFVEQFNLMPHILTTGWLIFFVIGAIYSLTQIKRREYLLIILISAIFFIFMAAAPYHEDRYILPILPVYGIIAAIGVMTAVNTIIRKDLFRLSRENTRLIICIIIALILGLLALNYGLPMINSKGPSYGSVQDIGIELSSMPNSVVYTPFSVGAPMPQLCLWAADKEYKPYPNTSEEFFANFKEGELAYCSIGYDTCPQYLLPKLSSQQEADTAGMCRILSNNMQVLLL